MDFHGPLANGNELMVLIDEFSRYPLVGEVTTTAFHHVAPKLNEIFSMMGVPEVIKTDNGPPFNGEQFSSYLKSWGINHRKVTPYYPQANGQVENFNRNIKKVIQRSHIDNVDWRGELQAFLRGYRSTPHESTGVAPAKLIFIDPNLSKLPQRLSHGQDSEQDKAARKRDKRAKKKAKHHAGRARGARSHELEPGDRVVIDQTKAKKLNHRRTARFGSTNLTITDINGSMITVVDDHGHQTTRNSAYFKRIGESLRLDHPPARRQDSDYEPNHHDIDNGHVAGNKPSDDATPAPRAVEQPDAQPVRRQSTRQRRSPDRYVAEPASGLLNRQPINRR